MSTSSMAMKNASEDIRKSSSASSKGRTPATAKAKGSAAADKARAINNYNNMLRKENGGVAPHDNGAFTGSQPSLTER